MSKHYPQTSSNLDYQRVLTAINGTPWDFGNSVLYDLCKKYPEHNSDEKILAKIWLIGRSYSAAIERRKNSNQTGDVFYLKTVLPTIRGSKIDNWLSSLANEKKLTTENYSRIIAVHKMLTDLFFEISGMEKRSLASKYLHFHFPHLFYIYDSRASSAISKITTGVGRKLPALISYDNVYARFFLRCMALVDQITMKYHVELTPRQLDTYLLGLD
ncbi:hypothetical protein ACFLXI_08480 [Chloroflexota bacterium]